MEISLCYFVIYTIEALILWQYTSIMFFPKIPKWAIALSLFCFYLGLFFVSFARNSLLNGTAFFLINFLFIFLTYDLKWYTAFFHASITTIVTGLGELAVYRIVPSFTPDFYAESTYFRNLALLGILSKTIYFLILYALSHLFKQNKERKTSGDKTSLLLSIVPVSSFFVTLTLFALCDRAESSVFLDWMVSISAILMLAMNLLIFAINSHTQKKSMEFTEIQLLLQKEYDSTEYYKMLLQQSENQSILIHDIKKHLQSIALLNEESGQDKISAYIDHLIHSSDLQDSVHLCDHELLNAILCRYKRQCQEKQIVFRTDIRSNTTNFIADNDLTSLFCNLLDNAFESAEKMPDSYIELNVSNRKNSPLTVLTMINSCRRNPFSGNSKQLPTTKPNKRMHGYGLKSVRRVIEKYDGDMQMYYDEETVSFHTIIAIKRPGEFWG